MGEIEYGISVKMLLIDDDKCLLLRRSMNSKGNPGKWELPGGKVDDGESLEVALVREVEEETGLVTEITGLVGTAESMLTDKKIVYVIMEGRTGSNVNVIELSKEHDDFTWALSKDLKDFNISPTFREFFKEIADVDRT